MNSIKNTNKNNLYMTKDEQDAYDFLSQSHPEWANHFINQMFLPID